MNKKKEAQMITPRQYAELHEVAYTTVVGWLRLEMIEGAKKIELPHMKSHVYMIPDDAKPPELKPGPKKGSKRTSAVADDQAAASLAIEADAPAKPTKARNAGSKKSAKK